MQSLLKVVEDFVNGLRDEDGLTDRARNGEEATRTEQRGVPPASIVTPANQKIFKPNLDSNHIRNQMKNVKDADKERHTDSSINTLPVLLPKGADVERREQRPGADDRRREALDTEDSGIERKNRAVKKQMASSSQMAGNEVSVSNAQEAMDATSPLAKDKRLKSLRTSQRDDAGDMRGQAGGNQQRMYQGQAYPSLARMDIANARLRLAQASNRRKSLEPPIDSEDADRMDGLRNVLEGRKRPQHGTSVARVHDAGLDGIHGAKQYLGSDGGESVGASIGSAAGNSDALRIGKSRLGMDMGTKRQADHAADDFFDVSKLPPHLRKSLDLIKKRKLDASAKRRKAIDLTGLQRMKEYDPRRLMN